MAIKSKPDKDLKDEAQKWQYNVLACLHKYLFRIHFNSIFLTAAYRTILPAELSENLKV